MKVCSTKRPECCKDSSRGWFAGFVLLEALIALLVFSVALLGLAAMYTKTLSVSHSSYLRSLASIQVTDIEERIRANPAADMGVAGNLASDAYNIACSAADFAAALPNYPDNSTPNAVAALDAQSWCALLGRSFGAGITTATVAAVSRYDASVEDPAGATPLEPGDNIPLEYTVTLVWNERGLDGDNDQEIQAQTFVYTVRR